MNDQFDIKTIRKEFEEYERSNEIDHAKLQDEIQRVGNGPIWEKAKEAVKKEYGSVRWPIVMYLYEKMGGKK